MSTLDVVAYAGGPRGVSKPANFLDIGGGASAEVMANGLDVILGDPQVKAVFVNVFGGITACDAVANGIVQALEILGDAATKPLVVRSTATTVEEGRAILGEFQHPLVTIADTMDDGGRQGRRAPADRVARVRSRIRKTNHGNLPQQVDSKVIVQGMTGGEGTKHTAAHAEGGSQVVGGVNAARPAPPSTRRRRHPARLRHGQGGDGRHGRQRLRRVRPAGSPRTPSSRRSTPRSRSSSSSPRASRCRTPPSSSTTPRPWAPRASSARTAPASSAPAVARRHHPGRHHRPGPIGLVSKSGTLTYQMMYELRDIGFSTGNRHRRRPDHRHHPHRRLAAFEEDPETVGIVMIGEIGGDAEERAAAYIKRDHVTKPVVGYVAGFTAPEGKTMGHAGAIVSARRRAPRTPRRRPSRPPGSRSARRRRRPPNPWT
jgi:hypothetical protein